MEVVDSLGIAVVELAEGACILTCGPEQLGVGSHHASFILVPSSGLS
jgi:hypothetical protein